MVAKCAFGSISRTTLAVAPVSTRSSTTRIRTPCSIFEKSGPTAFKTFRPPWVMATSASNGPEAASRQASARASRWNWSHDTGKAFSLREVMGGSLARERRRRFSKPQRPAKQAERADQHLSPRALLRRPLIRRPSADTFPRKGGRNGLLPAMGDNYLQKNRSRVTFAKSVSCPATLTRGVGGEKAEGGRGVVDLRYKPLKRRDSEKEMQGNERDFSVSRAFHSVLAASRGGFKNQQPGDNGDDGLTLTAASRPFAWPPASPRPPAAPPRPPPGPCRARRSGC